MAETFQWTRRLNQEKVDLAYYKRFGHKYREYRDLWNKAGKDFLPRFPINLDIEVIDSCNLRCFHCFRNKELAEKMGLVINTGHAFGLKRFNKIMEEASLYGLMAINFGFSGECLLSPDLSEMIDMAHSSGILDIRLLTNGTSMTTGMADRLLESPLTFLSFSIDAGDANTYKVLKGRDLFDKLLNIVSYTYARRLELKRDFPLIRASFYTSPENDGEQEKFMSTFQPHVDFIDFQAFHDLRKLKTHDMRMDCRAPFQRLAIFANGDVSPCCSFYSKKLIVGNVDSLSLKQIWDSEQVHRIRDGMLKKRPVFVCADCLTHLG